MSADGPSVGQAVPAAPSDRAPPAAPRPVEHPSALHFDLTAFAYFVIITGGGLPTPLYVIYQKEWGFSSGILTIIFAAYAAGLLLMLLRFGRLSDRIGRRPVLLLSILVAVVSTVVFLLATSVAWLIVARVLSGMSVGLCANTASAALTDYEPTGDKSRAALTVAVITAAGVGIGPFYAGILAQYAPDPLTLSFWVLFGLLVLAFGAVLAIRGTAERPAPPKVGERRFIRVPADLRPVFALAALAAFVGFALAGIFSGLSPSFLSADLKITNHAVSGATVLLMFGTAALAPLFVGRLAQRRMLTLGAACVPIGLAAITAAVWTGVALPFFVGTVICGVGFGVCLRGGIGLLNQAAPADERAEVFSAFFVAAYLGLSVPVVSLGVMADLVGLPIAALVLAIVISLLTLPVLLGRGGGPASGESAPDRPPGARATQDEPPPRGTP